jgi:hypothetical protein
MSLCSTDGKSWTLQDLNFTSSSLAYSPYINEYVAQSNNKILHSPTLGNWKEILPNGLGSWTVGNGVWVTTNFGGSYEDGQIWTSTDFNGDNWTITYDTQSSSR